MRTISRTLAATAPLAVLLALTACGAPRDEADDAADTADDTSTETTAEACTKDSLQTLAPGTLTIGTDSPAYEPWFVDDDPSNGKGYESAVAYAIAEQLGYSTDEVEWVTVPFNAVVSPGEKKFDFDVNQVSITPEREKVVDFSEGYYSAAQGVIALKNSPVADAASVAELADFKLGAQTGTTSLTAIRDVIKPGEDPLVFNDTNAAKQALLNGQVDAILADVPTAFYITAVEIPEASIVGQFQPETGQQEQFGMLFEEGSGLVPCVDEALASLRADGTLADIEKQWLSDVVNVPVLE